jgi:intracellular septation protein A
MNAKKILKLTAILVVGSGALLALSGCADTNTLTGHARDALNTPAGFWRGLWHGICAPFSFIGIMFGMDIGIYDSFNTGNWYNFGFLLGIGALGGGASSSSSRKG